MPPIPSSRLILTDLILQLKASDSRQPRPSDANPLKARQQDGVREIIVALEYLVPGGVMAALDVLDKGLVTRYSLKPEGETGEGGVETTPVGCDVGEAPEIEREVLGTPNGSGSEISEISDVVDEGGGGGGGGGEDEEEEEREPPKNDEKYAYYVRSDQPPSSRWSKKPARPTATTYSVRPTAWFCSCPAFLFAAFASAPKPVATSRHPDFTSRKWEADEFARVWDMMETHGWVWGGRMLGIHAPPVCKHLLACVLAENCGGLFMPFVNRVELGLAEMVGMGVDAGRI